MAPGAIVRQRYSAGVALWRISGMNESTYATDTVSELAVRVRRASLHLGHPGAGGTAEQIAGPVSVTTRLEGNLLYVDAEFCSPGNWVGVVPRWLVLRDDADEPLATVAIKHSVPVSALSSRYAVSVVLQLADPLLDSLVKLQREVQWRVRRMSVWMAAVTVLAIAALVLALTRP